MDTTDAPETWRLSPSELAAALREEIRISRVAEARAGALIAEIETRGIKAMYGYHTTATFLMHLLNISRSEANQRVRRARALNPARGREDGNPIPAAAPTTGAAASEGAISDNHIDVILNALKKAPPSVAPKERESGEKVLGDLAREVDPVTLAKAAAALLTNLGPDRPVPHDTPPKEPTNEARRRLRADGRVEWTLTLTGVAAAQAELYTSERTPPATDDETDTRSHAEKLGDTWAEVISHAIGDPELPSNDGIPLQLTLTTTISELLAESGTVPLEGGRNITAREARRVCCEADVYVAILSGTDVPLDLSRLQRYASPGQRRALALRDQGCAFPGCRRTPRDCDAHHVIHWLNDGETKLENLCLLCPHHHQLIHTSPWEVHIADDGKPTFTPPDDLDPQRRPQRNTAHDTSAVT
ncbi:protein of unknown function [Amycolatopsis xylanica]|uniref:HNH nuclease domain-containing protein n=1 Tax=Amycolatopsis xylanica TaxID=589385 RepID=A0A1H2T5H5_9PSEU|nr:HNH endonuclease signature motif containing protein [Amycolatopsis xylanica]SDW38484.1 protein of unknown function [Amycolatopsis xylanica]